MKRMIIIVLATSLTLFIGTQIFALISLHMMDPAEKCVAIRHIERNERPWEDAYWQSDEMLERACSIYQTRD